MRRLGWEGSELEGMRVPGKLHRSALSALAPVCPLWLGGSGGVLVLMGPPAQPGLAALSALWIISVKLR